MAHQAHQDDERDEPQAYEPPLAEDVDTTHTPAEASAGMAVSGAPPA